MQLGGVGVDDGEQLFLHRLWEFQQDETGCGVKIVLAGIVDHSKTVQIRRPPIRQDSIELRELEVCADVTGDADSDSDFGQFLVHQCDSASNVGRGYVGDLGSLITTVPAMKS